MQIDPGADYEAALAEWHARFPGDSWWFTIGESEEQPGVAFITLGPMDDADAVGRAAAGSYNSR